MIQPDLDHSDERPPTDHDEPGDATGTTNRGADCKTEETRSQELRFSAIDSEFRALRTEIGRLIDHQKDLHNLSFVSLAALLAFIGVLAKEQNDPKSLPLTLLLVPFLTLQFALTASDLSRRILQLGQYLHILSDRVNQTILAPTKPCSKSQAEVWNWEQWKAENYDKKSRTKKKLIILLEKARWLSLTFPGLLAIGAYLILNPPPWESKIELVLFVLALAVMLYSIIALIIYPSEAKGIQHETDEGERHGYLADSNG